MFASFQFQTESHSLVQENWLSGKKFIGPPARISPAFAGRQATGEIAPKTKIKN